jgi:hypothetical protein
MEEAEHKLKLDRQKEIEQERLVVRRCASLKKSHNLMFICDMLLLVWEDWSWDEFCTANEGPVRIHINVWFPFMYLQK